MPELPSLEALYDEHFAFVWRSLRGLGVAQSQLDDATQEVFVVVHRRGEEFERRSSVRTWLFAIAFRVAANFRRGAKRRAADPLSSELESEQPTPEQGAERAEMVHFVERVLDGLEDGQRAAFTACILEGMSAPEAADALGLNVNTLYSRLRAVRAKFASALAKRDGRR
ncbi:MAG TPA: RNA polymerase sigma factor [Polyangiaceae bacterium]|nr:RNA polymerase sigma factor [Polyangiaceae bacterium]